MVPKGKPPMVKVRDPRTGLWYERPAQVIGRTDSGELIYEGGQATWPYFKPQVFEMPDSMPPKGTIEIK